MNTFLLAAVALGLVAFLVIQRKRQASGGGASPKDAKRPGLRARSRTRRDGTIQGYPDPAPEAPAAASAETAASRTLSPVLEPLPAAEPAPPPAEPATGVADWGFDEMIVEPGWPLPGEIAGAWAGGAPVTEPPVAAPPLAEPFAVTEVETDVVDTAGAEATTGEWELPGAGDAPYGEAEPRAFAAEPLADAPAGADAEPAMEAWVPGITEVEPVVLPEQEQPAPVVDEDPVEEPVAEDPEPALVWADPAPAVVEEPAEDAFAGPPAWQPEAEIAPVDEPAEEPLLPAWAPEPVAVAAPVVELAEEVDPDVAAVAAGLPRAVAALTPVHAADDAVGVTPRMAAVLRALADEPRALPDLARTLDMSRALVADLCDRLEALHLVRREADPDERRRRMFVVATLKGLWLARESVAPLDRDAVAGALDRLSPAERAAFVSAVRVLQEAGASSAR